MVALTCHSFARSLSHRSLSKITFGDAGQPATMESSMTEADFSDKGLGVPGAIVIASFMAKWWALALISSQLSSSVSTNVHIAIPSHQWGIDIPQSGQQRPPF